MTGARWERCEAARALAATEADSAGGSGGDGKPAGEEREKSREAMVCLNSPSRRRRAPSEHRAGATPGTYLPRCGGAASGRRPCRGPASPEQDTRTALPARRRQRFFPLRRPRSTRGDVRLRAACTMQAGLQHPAGQPRPCDSEDASHTTMFENETLPQHRVILGQGRRPHP